jgi:hypothetical protein
MSNDMSNDDVPVPVTYYLMGSSVDADSPHRGDVYDHGFCGVAYRLLAVRAGRAPEFAWYLDRHIEEAAEELRDENGTPTALWSWGLSAIVARDSGSAETLARAAIERLRDAGRTHLSFEGWVQ